MQAPSPERLRSVLDSVFASSPGYDWTPDRDPWAWLRRGWASLVAWLHDLAVANPLGFRILLYAAVGLLLLILGHALWLFLRTIRNEPGRPDVLQANFDPIHDAAWFEAESRRHVAEGDYRAAMMADFNRLLLSFESRNLVTLQPSTTPAEYLHKVDLPSSQQRHFAELVRQLYGFVFAEWPCGATEYDHWRVAVHPDRYASSH